jgi:hypothetical protein
MSPIPESTDYPSLRLGHPTTSCTSVNIVGLDVKVYGLDEVKHSSLPLAAVVSLRLASWFEIWMSTHNRSQRTGDVTTKSKWLISPMVSWATSLFSHKTTRAHAM